MQALKALVIGMGILILVAMAVLTVTIYKRATAPGEETAVTDVQKMDIRQTERASSLSFGTVDLPVPRGAHVEAMEASDGRLMLRLRLNDGDARILVVDLTSGILLGTFVLQSTP